MLVVFLVVFNLFLKCGEMGFVFWVDWWYKGGCIMIMIWEIMYILLVEDDIDMLCVLVCVLEWCGF